MTCLLSVPAASGYGLSKYPDSVLAQGSLVYAAVARHHINYCIRIDSSNTEEYPEVSIDPQVRYAMSLWLAPVQQAIGARVHIVPVQCSSNDLDLMVWFTPEPLFDNSHELVLGKTRYFMGKSKPFTRIQINTSFEYIPGDRVHNFSDIAEHISVPTSVTLLQAMQTADSRRMLADDLGKWADVARTTVGTSSYAVLVHEFGHGFMLCDSDIDTFTKACDVTNSDPQTANAQPQSIMNVTDCQNFLYLTDDDIAGVTAITRYYVSYLARSSRPR